jgi:hypothetical protein
MPQLLETGVDSSQTADKVLDVAAELHRQQLLELANAAWWRGVPTARSSCTSQSTWPVPDRSHQHHHVFLTDRSKGPQVARR